MPRNLPWRDNTSTKTSTKKPTKPSAAPVKRKRIEKLPLDGSDSEDDDPRPAKGRKGEPASSPPPSPPPECFMKDGLENDDKYRMVEDEFLSVAQKFTVHLHAAEYKKQQKMAQTRNAKTITSISRPVVGDMPDHTRRRVEGIERSEKQRNAIGGLLDKKKSTLSEDSDSGDGLPYVGTTLHGLMDNPRRRGISLSKMVSTTTTTRAAAGYRHPTAQLRDSMFPKKPKTALQLPVDQKSASSTSSDVTDDLNAPLVAPETFKKGFSVPAVAKVSLPSKSLFQSKPVPDSGTRRSKTLSGNSNTGKQEKPKGHPSVLNDSPPLFSTGPVRMSRFERARQLKEKEDHEQKLKKARNLFPEFL